MSAIEVDVGVDGTKSKIKVKRRRGHECIAGNFSESVLKITDVDTVVIVIIEHHSAREYIGIPVCNDDILACIGLLVVNIKARGGTTSRGTRRGASIRCLALRRKLDTATR